MTPREELGHLVGRLSRDALELVERLVGDIAEGPSQARLDLFSLVRELDDEEVRQLLGVARAMALPVEETINPESRIVTPEFSAEFRARLQAHHATHTTPMDRLSFENAFLAASRAAGRATEQAPSRTTRFFDATVDGEHVALKTEGAKSMKRDQLLISKLSEAAWIQDMRSGRKRRERMMAFLDEFLGAVDRIVVLRYYRAEPVPHYELVEIPVSHFKKLRHVSASEFNHDAPRLQIADEAGPLMEVRLDRSDSKITVGKVEKSRCIVHCDWRLTGMGSAAAPNG